MPGYRSGALIERCDECDGSDVGGFGVIVHYPWCSTQPDFEAALQAKTETDAALRRAREEYAGSDEAKRVRALRSARVLPDEGRLF